MKGRVYCLALFALLAVPIASRAPILDIKQLSLDFKHWSSWQVLQRDEKKTKVGVFTVELAIPEREYQRYWGYIEQYQKLDVPWTSDEEAAVDWILKKEPDFFDHSLPFIGYIQ